VEDVDDTYAALALMYGYAARYAPSTVIEARINALVGTNMLGRLLHVQNPTAKQAVITAIDLLGRAVITAAEMGISFPLKRRDQLLEYVLTLMGRDQSNDLTDFNSELLYTQSVALSACTTLVSLEPRLPMETRNRVMKVCVDMLQHRKTLLIVCLLLEEHLYCLDLFYIPLSGNIRFFCIANRALKHC
jgi:hypothetical protein